MTSLPLLRALNASDKNFEIYILLKWFKVLITKNSGVDTAHHGPGVGVVSYALRHKLLRGVYNLWEGVLYGKNT